MLKRLLDRFFSQGHERSQLARKNILLSLLFSSLTIAINLALVPLTLHYLDKTKYGIWMTISSIIGWFALFDIGLGNGLRNKFAEAKAQGKIDLAVEYVSTTYASLFLISAGVFSGFNLIYPGIRWAKLLNVPAGISGEVSRLIYYVVSFFCLKFVLGLIGTLFTANQKPAINSLISFSSTALSFICIYLITLFSKGSLVLLGSVMSLIPVIVLAAVSIVAFSTSFSDLKPSFRKIKMRHLQVISSLGIGFFILQVSNIVMFSTSNIIISRVLGPESVTPYAISFRYFNIVTMFYSIIVMPYWTGFTDAFYKGDHAWIGSTMRSLNRLSVIIAALLILMALFANSAYRLWVGPGIIISPGLSGLMAIYVLLMTWMTPFVSYLNGVSKIRLQLLLCVITTFANIPITVFLAKTLHLGLNGVILGPILCLIPFAVLMPVQYRLLSSGRARRIFAQ
jgi:O-antigen/teichoic acid export membrane protein